MQKNALITGINGQDGSYLAEFLLSKGYDVHGIIRRSSTFNTQRIDHIFDKLNLYYGDLSDSNLISKIIQNEKIDEIYHLGAQSHVQVSFSMPEYTSDITGIGTLRILESIKNSKRNIKFYNACSSEQFGSAPAPQNEQTVFQPQSPYAVAKLMGYWNTVNYRNGFNMFASNGILFNHESIPKNSPVILRENNLIDILPIEELFKSHTNEKPQILSKYINMEIWDGTDWTKILNGTCYYDKNKKMNLVQTTLNDIETTLDHAIFMEDNTEIESKNLKIGDKLFKTNYPILFNNLNSSVNFAKLLGFIAGDGCVDEAGRIRISGTNENEIIYYSELFKNEYGCNYKIKNIGPGNYNKENSKDIYSSELFINRDMGKWIRSILYTKKSKEKKVPKYILNSTIEIKKAFIDGYYDADGRKAGSETYKYKGFTTKSATLALGLSLLFNEITDQEIKINCWYRDGRRYYYGDLTSPIKSNKGNHKLRIRNEIIKITETSSENGWFYDLQTENQTFASGPNIVKIHNSPRRGETFVTRKITKGICKILSKKQQYIELGNLESKRDWGFAAEYVKLMWKILQNDTPIDVVVGNGETHTIRQFLETCLDYVGIQFKTNSNNDYIIVDSGEWNLPKDSIIIRKNEKYFRPTEVDHLEADTTYSKQVLGIETKIKFKELVSIMMDFDMMKEGLIPIGESIPIILSPEYSFTTVF